ncbi:hypothetical protein Tco_0413424, partial [Tanacetum coccineum]
VRTEEQLVEVNTTTTRAENDSLMDQNFYGGSKDKCNYEAEILSLDGILELMVALEILISMAFLLTFVCILTAYLHKKDTCEAVTIIDRLEARIAADKAYDVAKVDDRLNRAVECQQSCQCC